MKKIYFLITEITSPDGMRFQEYNTYNRAGVYIAGKCDIYDNDNGKFSFKQKAFIKLSCTIKLYPHTLWEGIVKDHKENRHLDTFTVAKVVTFHPLPPCAYIAHKREYVMGILCELNPTLIPHRDDYGFLEKIPQELIDKHTDVEYFDLWDLKLNYHDTIIYWGLVMQNGYSLKYLVDAGCLLKEDPVKFLMENPKITIKEPKKGEEEIVRPKMTELITKNPMKWTLDQRIGVLVVDKIIDHTNKNLAQHITYENKNLFIKKVKLDLIKDFKTIRVDGINPYQVDDYIEKFYQVCVKGEFLYEDKDKLVYRHKYWTDENSVIDSLECMRTRLSSFDSTKYHVPEKIESQQQQFIANVLSNSTAPFHVLAGRAGTGKTTTCKQLVKELLRHPNNNVLLTSFMGATVSMMSKKIQEVIRSEGVTRSELECCTIHTFSRRISSVKMLAPEDGVQEGDPPYASFLQHLKYIIVDEIGVIDLALLRKLLGRASRFAVKVLFVGDYDQILSIKAGDVMRDLMVSVKEYGKDGILTELKTVHRFSKETDLSHNLTLVYARSNVIMKEFNKNMDKTVRIQPFSTTYIKDGMPDLKMTLEHIYRSHGTNKVQCYTWRKATRDAVTKTITESENYNQFFKINEHYQLEDGTVRTLPKIKIGSYMHPGTRIMITKNTREKTVDLYVVNEKSIWKHTSEGAEFMNLRMFITTHGKGLFDHSKESQRPLIKTAKKQRITSSYVSNGQTDVIEKVEFAFERAESGAILNYYYIYTLMETKIKVVVGPGVLNPENIEYGICNTICKMQGWEIPIGVLILTQDDYEEKGRREDRKMDYSTFLVGVSRASEVLYILAEYATNRPAKYLIQRIVSTDRKERYSKFHHKLLTFLTGKNGKRERE